MSVRSILVVALAVVCGGSAAVGFNKLRNNESTPGGIETVPVVVATGPIARGTTITADLVKTKPFPKDLAPSGSLRNLEDAIDRAVYTPLVADEAVLEGKLASKGAGRGIASLIPIGMRAFTITTPNVAAGVAGFVLPGNKVDVLLTVSSPGINDETGGGTTTTLLQNVEILAVDQRMDVPNENKVDPKEMRSVTLLVTPDQAAKLDLGQNKGILHLTLRHPNDERAADTRPTTLASLRFRQEKPWDERAKSVLDSVAKVAGEFTKNQSTKQPQKSASLQSMIRTFRGQQEGAVYLQGPRSLPEER